MMEAINLNPLRQAVKNANTAYDDYCCLENAAKVHLAKYALQSGEMALQQEMLACEAMLAGDLETARKHAHDANLHRQSLAWYTQHRDEALAQCRFEVSIHFDADGSPKDM